MNRSECSHDIQAIDMYKIQRKSLNNFKKILFLDFDGVLLSSHFRKGSEFSKIPLLEELTSKYDLEVVISSSWRFHYSLPELKSKVGKKLGDIVIDTTGEACGSYHARFNEISEWLEFHPKCDWRALDDSKFEFPADCRNLILCDSRTGINQTQVNSLIDWLEK